MLSSDLDSKTIDRPVMKKRDRAGRSQPGKKVG